MSALDELVNRFFFLLLDMSWWKRHTRKKRTRNKKKKNEKKQKNVKVTCYMNSRYH
jgi:hypothetical protein